MREIGLAAWDRMINMRDMTYLELFIIAGLCLSTWRLMLFQFRLLAKFVMALAVVFFVAVMAFSLWQLSTL